MLAQSLAVCQPTTAKVCCKSLGLGEYMWILTSMSSWYNTSLTSSLFLRLRPLKVKVCWPWTGLECIHYTVKYIYTTHTQVYTAYFFSIFALVVHIVGQAVHDSDGIDPLQCFNVLLGNFHFLHLVLNTVHCRNGKQNISLALDTKKLGVLPV